MLSRPSTPASAAWTASVVEATAAGSSALTITLSVFVVAPPCIPTVTA